MGVEGYLAHLLLHQPSQWESRVAELVVGELSQEVCLVLYGVDGCAQPHQPVALNIGGIVAGGHKVVLVAYALFERTELDEAVAHDVGVRRQTLLDAFDGVAHHLVPVFLLQVGDLEVESVHAGRGAGQLDVLVGCARRVLALHAYLNIM